MKKTNSRNGNISLWKFVFSIIIVIYHTSLFYSADKPPIFSIGYIGVEFFFLVSGYYLAKKALSNKKVTKEIGIETFKYTFAKFKSFFPYLFITYIISMIILRITKELNIFFYTESIWNLMLLNGFGVGKVNLFGQIWYLTVYLISSMVLYPLIRKYRENYIYIFGTLISILGFVYLYKRGSLDLSHVHWDGYMSLGLIRALIEMNFGTVIYVLSENTKKYKLTKFAKNLLGFVGNTIFITIVVSLFYIDRIRMYQYTIFLMMIIGVYILMIESETERKIFNNKFVYYLEKLSIIIFIFHSASIKIVQNFFLDKITNPINITIIVVLITIVASIIIEKLVESIRKKQFGNKIIKLIIK